MEFLLFSVLPKGQCRLIFLLRIILNLGAKTT